MSGDKKAKTGIGSLDIFIKNIERSRKNNGKGTLIEVMDRRDRKDIEKHCGRAYLNLFGESLIFSTCDEFFFIFRQNDKSFRYSIERDGIVVNFAYFPKKEELKIAETDAAGIKTGFKDGYLVKSEN